MVQRCVLSSLDTTTEHWDKDKENIITITVKERYPVSSEALMKRGFCIILLNMTFGLLPITISGSKVKYLKCSLSQLYANAFGLSIIGLSIIFVTQQMNRKMELEQPTGTGLILTGLVTLAHVCGFLLLMIRGHWLAKCFPTFWAQLTKLLQKSVIDVFGTEYEQLRLISCFARNACIGYIFVLILNSFLIYASDTMFIIYLFNSFGDIELLQSDHNVLWYSLVTAGFGLWEMCNLSHILVSMLLCFLIRSITVCLRSINEQLQHTVGKLVTKSTIAAIENEEIELRMTKVEEKIIIDKLENFTMCYALCQELTNGLSRGWGISIIVELLVGVINVLGHVFGILKGMYDPKWGGVGLYFMQNYDDIPLAFSLGITHFYFLFKLSCYATEMFEESRMPLIILNLVSYQKWPVHIQHKIQIFKIDISNSSISLTASNYFPVTKYLITSVFGAITSYLIILLQFTQTEAMRGNGTMGTMDTFNNGTFLNV